MAERCREVLELRAARFPQLFPLDPDRNIIEIKAHRSHSRLTAVEGASLSMQTLAGSRSQPNWQYFAIPPFALCGLLRLSFEHESER